VRPPAGKLWSQALRREDVAVARRPREVPGSDGARRTTLGVLYGRGSKNLAG
jgi:hypothetical protein